MFLFDGLPNARLTILLAHGAGAPMDSAAMTAIARALAAKGFRVARFEFGYMAARRTSGARRLPPRAELLNPEFIAAVNRLDVKGPLIIGGKSMGGRVASMVADDLHASGGVAGLLCVGYPFHPIGKPDKPRVAHLASLRAPTLIVQGTRDAFGSRAEVSTYDLAKSIDILWLEDGDHDLKPRKAPSGFSVADHLATMSRTVLKWANVIDPN
jgi:predicted alpha/beta-hydrolase family hydrolase